MLGKSSSHGAVDIVPIHATWRGEIVAVLAMVRVLTAEDGTKNGQVQECVVFDMADRPILHPVSVRKSGRQREKIMTHVEALSKFIHLADSLGSEDNVDSLDRNLVAESSALSVHDAWEEDVGLHAESLAFFNDLAICVHGLGHVSNAPHACQEAHLDSQSVIPYASASALSAIRTD